ncbi:lipocalin family protein [Oceanimonas baumannii]|uniref:lipocalin family protein n=1 Tax=Oceanimonas baumannii TaxID=129578 RepID=UPI001D188FCE|nr:lipocalin family protein [Oceanimonas baumannii]MCC4264230.1 lipocalin family protein [Oceanimonas baumannii]
MRKGLFALLLLLTACAGKPDGITPVSGFELNRYLGTWFEVARLDHGFERGLEQVTAHYSLRDDGGVKVINRGFDAGNNEWKEAEGKAYFVGSPDTAHLKVSFFGPFYGAYVVFALYDDYQHALVSGPSRDYLWLLARTPELDAGVQQALLEKASKAVFNTDKLIFVSHQ